MQSESLPDRAYSRSFRMMGNRFALTVVCGEASIAEDAMDTAISEMQRIEDLLTTFNGHSQVARINEQAGIAPVQVDPELVQLILRAHRISELTQGAFDITYGSMDQRFWNFDLEMTELPDPFVAKASVRLINYRNILVHEADNTVFLKEKGMRIGFGGIGKGYAADRAAVLLRQKGIQSGIVNASGDLCAWGAQPDGSPWTIGLSDPDAAHLPFGHLPLKDMAIATSGNYEKFVMIGGKKYSHTIDPRTGYPVSGIKSVTMICQYAELADAMTTPVMVMGIRAGLHMVNQIPGLYALLIDDDGKVFTSENLKLS